MSELRAMVVVLFVAVLGGCGPTVEATAQVVSLVYQPETTGIGVGNGTTVVFTGPAFGAVLRTEWNETIVVNVSETQFSQLKEGLWVPIIRRPGLYDWRLP